MRHYRMRMPTMDIRAHSFRDPMAQPTIVTR